MLTDRSYLAGVQYRTHVHLAARQSIYAYQHPRIDLAAAVLDHARLSGAETVADIGCGNGIYLSELARRGHAGPLIGVDLSAGMLAAAKAAAPTARLISADAAALPLADGAADVTLAPHMLYHVPDPVTVVAEFRRVTRAGGQVLVVLNGPGHVGELRDLVLATAHADGQQLAGFEAEEHANRAMTLEVATPLLRDFFGEVTRHDFVAQLVLTSPEPVAAYAASLPATQSTPDPAGFSAAVAARVPFGPDRTFRVTTHSGVLACR
jgi:SAM-dependent methyltransferase